MGILATNDHEPWGRVDETGTVFVREADGERAVGQYPDGTAEEALAYFERKYVELAGQVTLLEQRVKRGTASADVARTIDEPEGDDRDRERRRRPRRVDGEVGCAQRCRRRVDREADRRVQGRG